MICLFLLVYLAIASVVAGANRSDPAELVRSMGIWLVATDLFVLSASLMPSRRVFRLVWPTKRSPIVAAAVFAVVCGLRIVVGAAAAAGAEILNFIRKQEVMIVADIVLEAAPAALAAAAVLALQASATAPVRERSRTGILDVPLGTDSPGADSDLSEPLLR
jgi:hypothetical protein